ncbi:MAG TPA: hypothetical protein VE549_10450 [Myxococcaceae bacterium]|jgi:hypothetical protein|nr:hypothetical protein [Myxococcaceae bacterium]
MSSPQHSDATQGTPLAAEPEDERLPIPLITAVGLVSTVVFALGILWAVQIMSGVEEDNTREFGARGVPTELGKPEIGMVDQTLFKKEERADQLKREKLEQLSNPGWVDRKGGIVRIPIDQAMKEVAEGKRPAAPRLPELPPAPRPDAPMPGLPLPTGAPAAPSTGTGGSVPPSSPAPQKP